MAIVIKTLKNNHKIARALYKEFKKALKVKPNLLIGADWHAGLFSILQNFPKLNRLSWNQTTFFPLAIYTNRQIIPLHKSVMLNFFNLINQDYKRNYNDLSQAYSDLDAQATSYKNLFITGGTLDPKTMVDYVLVHIDKNGAFLFQNNQSAKVFVNFFQEKSLVVAAGIKSLLQAKKILCFVTDLEATQIVQNLNTRQIMPNLLASYLHIHPDVTLYTTHSIIAKANVNNKPVLYDAQKVYAELGDLEDNKTAVLQSQPVVSKKAVTTPTNTETVLPPKTVSKVDSLPTIVSTSQKPVEPIAPTPVVTKPIVNQTIVPFLWNASFLKPLQDPFVDWVPPVVQPVSKPIVQPQPIPTVIDQVVEKPVVKSQITILPVAVKADFVQDTQPWEFTIAQPQPVGAIEKETFPTKKFDFAPKDYPKSWGVDLSPKKPTLTPTKTYQPLVPTPVDHNLPDDLASLQNYLKIKKHTLSQIDKLLYKASLDEAKRQLIKHQKTPAALFNMQQNNSPQKFSLTYQPGLWPTPMLMVWHETNYMVYYEIKKEMEETMLFTIPERFAYNMVHYHNQGAYIAFNKLNNEIALLAFSRASLLIFLLRNLNLPLTYSFNSETLYHQLTKQFADFEAELTFTEHK